MIAMALITHVSYRLYRCLGTYKVLRVLKGEIT